MGVYEDEFDSIEDAVEALKGAIEERDGKFVVGGELRKAFKEAGTVFHLILSYYYALIV